MDRFRMRHHMGKGNGTTGSGRIAVGQKGQHSYLVKTVWSGAAEGPARDYKTYSKTYSREHRFEIAGKPPIMGSADAAFHGDPALHNPEDLLVAALSSCHML